MKRLDLDKIFFVYCNAIHDALDRKNCKQAKGFMQEMFNQYTRIREGKSLTISKKSSSKQNTSQVKG